MTETWGAVSGTGHRPATRKDPDGITPAALPWVKEKARAGLLWLQREHRTTDVHSGLALGFDTVLAQAALDVGMALHAHIPFPQHPAVWPEPDQVEWWRLVGLATTVKTYGATYCVRLLHIRNDGLLDAAHDGVVFACWNAQKRTGGTASAIRKAVKRGLPILHIDPAARTVHAPGCPCVAVLRR